MVASQQHTHSWLLWTVKQASSLVLPDPQQDTEDLGMKQTGCMGVVLHPQLLHCGAFTLTGHIVVSMNPQNVVLQFVQL